MATYGQSLFILGMVAASYGVAILVVALAAVFHPDGARRCDARKVLRLLLSAGRRRPTHTRSMNQPGSEAIRSSERR